MIVASANSNKYEVKISLDGNDAIKPIIAVQPMELGGTGMDMRPGHLILSGFAGCIHVTAREILDEQKLIYDDVIVSVDMDNSVDGMTKFYSKVEIVSDTISDVKKNEIIAILKNCDVCKILANDKEFLDME